MEVRAKSSGFFTPRQLRELMVNSCPIKLFKHVRLVNDPEIGLSYAYKIPSKINLQLCLVIPVKDDFLEYLIGNELRIEEIPNQRFMIDSIRNLQLESNKILKKFTSTLDSKKIERWGSRIQDLRDAINSQCIPTPITESVQEDWAKFRRKAFRSLNYVKI